MLGFEKGNVHAASNTICKQWELDSYQEER